MTNDSTGAGQHLSIFVDEEAFGFLEGVLADRWPPYENYGHWGRTVIPMENWVEVIHGWDELARALCEASLSTEVPSIGGDLNECVPVLFGYCWIGCCSTVGFFIFLRMAEK
ncbi:hypothetical protein [Chitiniphilus shinanonensis]|uniref:hypothetical protein n=1 Tax=Chitiniphilus shinanonensis TaxID=553088 RepID=UPI003341CD43